MNQASLVVISHSYLHPQWQLKFARILDQFKEITIVQPHVHTSNGVTYFPSRCKSLENQTISFVSLVSLFPDSPTWYIYINLFRFLLLFFEKQPSIVLLEEDPHSLVGVATMFVLILFQRLRNKRTKLVLFTWDNINRIPQNRSVAFIKRLSNHLATKLCSGIIAGNCDAQSLARSSKSFSCPSVVLPQVAVPCLNKVNSRSLTINQQFIIGYIGRIVPQKGISTLLDACKHLARKFDIQLNIVGGGPCLIEYKEMYEDEASWLNFVGPVPFQDVYKHLKHFDLLVLPSIDTPTWREQFGLVLAQSMSLGIPCVGSDSGAIPDVIDNSDLIFHQKDSAALANVIASLLTSPHRYSQASATALRRYNDCFSSDSVGLNYSRFLQGIIDGKEYFDQPHPYGSIY
jgi:glycosyltransferase involved in cell wall biosynthesis